MWANKVTKFIRNTAFLHPPSVSETRLGRVVHPYLHLLGNGFHTLVQSLRNASSAPSDPSAVAPARSIWWNLHRFLEDRKPSHGIIGLEAFRVSRLSFLM